MLLSVVIFLMGDYAVIQDQFKVPMSYWLHDAGQMFFGLEVLRNDIGKSKENIEKLKSLFDKSTPLLETLNESNSSSKKKKKTNTAKNVDKLSELVSKMNPLITRLKKETKNLEEGLDQVKSFFKALCYFIRKGENKKLQAEELHLQSFIQLFTSIYPAIKFKLDGLSQNLKISTDKSLLSMVFMNLITNAVEHITAKDELENEVTIDSESNSNSVEITITNPGQISAELVEKFNQGVYLNSTKDPTRVSKDHESGKGLGSVRYCLGRLGGTIKLKSNNDQVQFIVTLPKSLTDSK